MVDSQHVDRTLALTRAHFRAPTDARSRVRAALLARGQGGAGPSSLPAGQRVAGVSKAGAVLLAGLTFIAGFWLGGQRAQEPAQKSPAPPLTRAAVAPVTDDDAVRVVRAEPGRLAEAAHAAPVLGSEADALKPARTVQQVAPARRRAVPEGSFAGELSLLQRAERAIRSGEPEIALGFLDDIDRRYPKTRFVEERTAARLMARCAHAESEARAPAEAFVHERSNSVYVDRVRELCNLERAPATTDGSRTPGH